VEGPPKGAHGSEHPCRTLRSGDRIARPPRAEVAPAHQSVRGHRLNRPWPSSSRVSSPAQVGERRLQARRTARQVRQVRGKDGRCFLHVAGEREGQAARRQSGQCDPYATHECRPKAASLRDDDRGSHSRSKLAVESGQFFASRLARRGRKGLDDRETADGPALFAHEGFGKLAQLEDAQRHSLAAPHLDEDSIPRSDIVVSIKC